jgi:hypothetical protein
MPIRINLLAEAQAAEEQRRKNPVRRAVWIAGFGVCAVLLWALKLQLDLHFAKLVSARSEARLAEIAPKCAEVTNNQAEIAQIAHTMAALDRLRTNRFFWAPLLNALQKTTVDDIKVIRFSGDQEYTFENSGGGSSKAATRSASVEKISLYLEAEDSSADKQGFNRYMESLNSSDYFVDILKRRDGFTLQGFLETPIQFASDPSRQFVTFVLITQIPDVRRGE